MSRQRLKNLWTLLRSKRLFSALATVLVLITLTSTSALMAMAEEQTDEQPALAETMADTTASAVSGKRSTKASATATTVTFEVLVTADGVTQEKNVLGGTVGDILAALGVTVGENDLLAPAADTVIDRDMEVTVSRVTYQTYTQTETVAYQTVTKNDNTLMSGTTKVKQEGKNGSKEVTYRETYVDGQLTGTEVIASETVTAATDKIVLKGTRRPAAETITVGGITLELDDKGQPLDYKKLISGKATAYTATEGKHTASGRLAQVGVVAVDPKVIPYGTKLYIVSPDGKWVYGYAVAGDTGGALRSGKVVVDLFYDTTAECYKFGRRTMNVYVIG